MENQSTPFMLFPTVTSRIVAGIISFTGLIIVLAWVAINEEARMQEFTERFQGRSVETGAILFENNCSSCHGQDGRGLTGVAPALNNPQLFGFSFFAEIDNELAVKATELERLGSANPARAAQLEAEIAVLQARRQELDEAIRYDYSSELAGLQAQLSSLDTEIVGLFRESHGIASASLLPIKVGELEAQKSAIELEQTQTQDRIAAAQAAGETPDAADNARLDALFDELDAVNSQLRDLNNYNQRRTDLVAKVGRFTAIHDAHTQILNLRMQAAELNTELATLPTAPSEGEDPNAARRQEIAAQLFDIETLMVAQESARADALQALIENGDIIFYDPSRISRMEELRWNGSLRDLIRTTLISGRPTSASYWNNPMAAWSQRAGGPLRDDQIENLVDYILNWGVVPFSVEDVRQVNQYAILPTSGAAMVEGVGTDVDAILAALEELETAEDLEVAAFDSNAGQRSYASADYGCVGCHQIGVQGTGPDPTGIYVRAEQYAAENPRIPSARYYLVQSIIDPNAFIVDGFSSGIMPTTFGDRLDLETLSNLIAYLESFD